MNTQRQEPFTIKRSFTPALIGLFRCSCGTHTMAGGKCEECHRKKQISQCSPSPSRGEGKIPLGVHEALGTPREPLDPAIRALMETRVRGNFSRITKNAASITSCLGWWTDPLKPHGRMLISPASRTALLSAQWQRLYLSIDAKDCSDSRPKTPEAGLSNHESGVPEAPV